jgi:chemotaxis protein MotB
MHDPNDPYARPPTRWKLGTWALLTTLAAGAGGYGTWEFRKRALSAQGQATTCQAALGTREGEANTLRAGVTACEGEREGLKVRSKESETMLAKMSGNLDATKVELEDLRKWKAETAKRIETFREMSTKLQKMVDAGKLGVKVRDGRLVLRLPENVLFPSGSAELSRDGELALMEMAVILKQFADRRFMVAGHTDNQPVKATEKHKDNWELSLSRAVVVTRFLVEAKVKPSNLVAAGYGEHDPIASNKSAEGRRENRRIDLVLLPDLSELPELPGDMAEAAKTDKK